MRIIYLGAAALLAASLAAGQALARDNCPRLESASLVIVIPEGGCDADAETVLAATREVTVIRGPGRARVAAAPSGTAVQAVAPDGSRTIVVVIDKRR